MHLSLSIYIYIEREGDVHTPICIHIYTYIYIYIYIYIYTRMHAHMKTSCYKLFACCFYVRLAVCWLVVATIALFSPHEDLVLCLVCCLLLCLRGGMVLLTEILLHRIPRQGLSSSNKRINSKSSS